MGDAVVLKEGDCPVMVVSYVNIIDNEVKEVTCKWYSKEKDGYKWEEFHKDMLKPYVGKKKKN